MSPRFRGSGLRILWNPEELQRRALWGLWGPSRPLRARTAEAKHSRVVMEALVSSALNPTGNPLFFTQIISRLQLMARERPIDFFRSAVWKGSTYREARVAERDETVKSQHEHLGRVRKGWSDTPVDTNAIMIIRSLKPRVGDFEDRGRGSLVMSDVNSAVPASFAAEAAL